MAKPTKYQLELHSKLRSLGYPAAHPKEKERRIWVVTLSVSGVALLFSSLSLLSIWVDFDEFGALRFVFPLVLAALVTAAVMAVAFAVSNLAGWIADTAEKAGRSWFLWFWLSLVITPVLTWLITASFKPVSTEELAARNQSQETHLEQKLKELLSLRDQGVISADEFEAAKRKVLGI